MRTLISIFLLTCLISAKSQDKQLCITVDDLPTVHYGAGGQEFQWLITDSIVSTLVRNKAIGIGYVNERKLYDQDGQVDSFQVKLLRHWLENGQELGNHTYSHMNYHRVSFEDYTRDILRGEQITRKLTDGYGSTLKFFRHPYLRSGLRKGDTDSLRNFLNKRGYTEAPVTIDNDDYLFALAYSRAFQQGDPSLMSKIGNDYVYYMEAKLLFYEHQSQKLFGRNIRQILLIHANFLNAHFLDDLMAMYKRHGYSFISQEEALRDEAYREEVTRFGDWGISWLDRWALSRGKKGDFFKGEPRTPEYIRDLTQ